MAMKVTKFSLGIIYWKDGSKDRRKKICSNEFMREMKWVSVIFKKKCFLS